MTVVAVSPDAKLDLARLAALASDLAQLLERETALVRALKIAEIAPLQAEKTRLTQLFRKTMTQLQGVSGTPLQASGPWLAAAKRLAEAAMENERALRVGRAATERLLAAIVNAVRQSRRAVSVYAPRRGKQAEPAFPGLALDRSL